MKINQKFYNDIKPILLKLRNTVGDDFVIFGSMSLYLLGVVDYSGQINDIDIALKDKNNIPLNAKVVTFQGNKNQQFYKIEIDGVSIDIGCEWEGCSEQKEFFKKIFIKPIEIDGFKFANLNIIEIWKKEMVEKYNREKDKKYLQKIKEYKISKKTIK